MGDAVRVVEPILVYVAGSSAERSRVRWCMTHIKSGRPRTDLTHDWLRVMEEAGPDSGLSTEVLARAGLEDLEAVQHAHVLWFLMPQAPTIGAWVELGFFARGARDGDTNQQLVISGPGPDPLFVATMVSLGAQRFASDQEAAEYISALVVREPMERSVSRG